jgi:hypothetical protein
MKSLIFVVFFLISLKTVFSQKVKYFERNALSFGLLYSPSISSHQWQIGTAGSGEAFFLPRISHYFSSFVAIELKPQRFHFDLGLGVYGRRVDYRWQTSINSKNSNVKMLYQNLNGFFGLRFKESKFDISLSGLFEKNLRVKSFLDGKENSNSFMFGFNPFYLGIRPSIGFEQKVNDKIFSHISLNLDLLTSNLISYGISIRVYRKNSQ